MHVVHSTVQLPGDLMGWWYVRHHAVALFNACVCLSGRTVGGLGSVSGGQTQCNAARRTRADAAEETYQF